jgi:hypothetical protein
VSAIVPDAAQCLSCNYPLKGLESGRCPECGRGFDPADPLTMNLGRPLGPAARALLRPIGRWADGCVWLVGAWGAWLSLGMLPRAVLLLWFGLGSALVLAPVVLRRTLRGIAATVYRQPAAARRADAAFDQRARRVIRVAIVLVLTRAPAYVAWWVSRPWTDAVARQVATDPVDAPLPPEQWAGLYRVEARWAGDHGVSFTMTPGVGFGHAYYGSSSGVESSFAEPLGGGWYTEP